MTDFALNELTNEFLQTNIDLAMGVRDDYWFLTCLHEKQSRIFNQNGEIDD